MRLRFLVWIVSVCLFVTGCLSPVERVGIAFLYRKAELPATQVRTNLAYEAIGSPKQDLNLFLPGGTNWPVLVFVYGGAWTMGDKNLIVGGADVYGNIGRFYAKHGIGVAVINYRLQPQVKWQDQVADVAHAVVWVHAHIAEYGGDPRRIFLSGHSAGAQLVTRVALDPKPLENAGFSTKGICGVIPVSGAGFDMTDAQTYTLGESPDYFAKRFDTGQADWQKDASPVTYAHPGAPPFLILYCGNEDKALKRQSYRLAQVLSDNSIPNQTVIVPGQSHARIVLTLSRDDKTAGPAILDFIAKTKCP